MQRRIVLLVLLSATGLCQGAPRLKTITLAVTNATGEIRSSENVTLRVKDITGIAPDFKAGTLIVATGDPEAMETAEIPSQADDLDGDGKYDEIAFQLDLKPHQTRTVTLSYGDAATIARLRKQYPARAYARFTKKYEGPGWESELTAWRIYFD